MSICIHNKQVKSTSLIIVLVSCSIDMALERTTCGVFIGILAILGAAFGCPSDICQCNNDDIICWGQGIGKVPEFKVSENDLTQVYNTLHLEANDIEELPPNAFGNLQVRRIMLGANPLGNSISPLAFTGLERSLESLDLWGCDLDQLPSGVFQNLSALKTIDLTDNNFDYIPIEELRDVKGLRRLSMESNSLKAVQKGSFGEINQIAELQLQYNRISEIEEGAFAGLSNLRRLRLHNNRISSLTPDAFTGLDNLGELDMSGNPLGKLDKGVFSALSRLQSLSLGQTNLDQIEAGAFAGLTHLKILKLDHNKLTALPDSAFPALTHLSVLDLSHNKFVDLGDACLSRMLLSSLINLDNNPIVCDCKMEWLRDMDSDRVRGTCAGPKGMEGRSLSREDNFMECPIPMCEELAEPLQ
ncbi:unnamed protein product [Owenia fusiformis]|uniref:Uncharacterized protein n=1 Tax=Owenia fusiformis TaxID=6347 RepID=A0A8J1Y822_OWEFU|nr:unnamed protein product [Owenia fusiformis]